MRTLSLLCALSLSAVSFTHQTPRPDPMGAHCLMPRPKLLAQEGNPGHHEPPPGWTCANGAHAEHACSCHRECVQSDGEDEQGNQTHETIVKEDPKCLAYCFKDHCTCGTSNCE